MMQRIPLIFLLTLIAYTCRGPLSGVHHHSDSAARSFDPNKAALELSYKALGSELSVVRADSSWICDDVVMVCQYEGSQEPVSLPLSEAVCAFIAVPGKISTVFVKDACHITFEVGNTETNTAVKTSTAVETVITTTTGTLTVTETKTTTFTEIAGVQLTNELNLGVKCLDIDPSASNAAVMNDCTANTLSQQWTAIVGKDGFFRLTNDSLGSVDCLDTYNDSLNEGFMNQCSAVTAASYWKIVDAGKGYFYLENEFLGDSRCLDNNPSTSVNFMGQCAGSSKGIFWFIKAQ